MQSQVIELQGVIFWVAVFLGKMPKNPLFERWQPSSAPTL
jgi:hypothetical protein